jgi:hypothetical protein
MRSRRIDLGRLYTEKEVNNFPIPSRDVTNLTFPGGGDNLIIPGQKRRFWLVTYQLGTGNSQTFFTVSYNGGIRMWD